MIKTDCVLKEIQTQVRVNVWNATWNKPNWFTVASRIRTPLNLLLGDARIVTFTDDEKTPMLFQIYNSTLNTI